jgi:pimeloyl-ACP methyl ester carboxylesterase
LAAFSRVIRYDKRGTGLSDPVATVPTLEQRTADLNAVLDAVSCDRVVVFGYSEGGPTTIRFAVRRTARTLGLIVYGAPCMPAPPDMAQRFRELARNWGQGNPLRLLAPCANSQPA